MPSPRINKASSEHQTWLDQARQLWIPVLTDTAPTMAKLKEWTVPWLRLDNCWAKLLVDDDKHLLSLHQFDVRWDDMRFLTMNLVWWWVHCSHL